MPIRIVSLDRSHRAGLRFFHNRHGSLVEFLTRYALRHAERDLLSRTWLAVDEDGRIAGYFSLAAGSVERTAVQGRPGLDRLPRFPIPVILLARLAVDERVQGQGVGRYLFEEALGRTLALAREGPVGFRVLVTDAIDAEAVRFYEHFGLARLSDEFPCRMVLDLHPLLRSTR
jgi:GNAT superfamily N-acetyltransferase